MNLDATNFQSLRCILLMVNIFFSYFLQSLQNFSYLPQALSKQWMTIKFCNNLFLKWFMAPSLLWEEIISLFAIRSSYIPFAKIINFNLLSLYDCMYAWYQYRKAMHLIIFFILVICFSSFECIFKYIMLLCYFAIKYAYIFCHNLKLVYVKLHLYAHSIHYFLFISCLFNMYLILKDNIWTT